MGSWKGIFHHVNIEKSWSVLGMSQASYQESQHFPLQMILTNYCTNLTFMNINAIWKR